MKCPHCEILNPTWAHIAWHRRRKRAAEREHEQRIEREERDAARHPRRDSDLDSALRQLSGAPSNWSC